MLRPPDRVDGVGMWGLEMLTWSDAGVSRGDPSVALMELVLTEGLGRDDHVLLVGPHPPHLVEVLADLVGRVDVLVRSWPDAVALAERGSGDGVDVDVHCGSWDRFDPRDERWDLVLVPDGLGSIDGPDAAPAAWPDVLARMTALTTERGSVVVGVGNPLATTLLWSVDGARRDEAWPLPPGSLPAPVSAQEVREWSEARGSACRVLSLYPHLRHPTVAVDDAVLADPTDPRLVRALTAAFVGDAELPVRRHDPRASVGLVLRQRLGSDLAPGWYVRLGQVPSSTLPRLYESETSNGSHFGSRVVHEVEGPRWTRGVPAVDAGERRSGPVVRDTRTITRDVPGGPSLEDTLLEACAARDLAGVRAVARTYLAWLAEQASPADWTSPWSDDDVESCRVVAGRLVFVDLAHLYAPDGAPPQVVDEGWDLAWPLPLEVVLTSVLTRFADRLVTSGAPHPFPVGESPWGVARSLAAMAGVRLRDRDGERAGALATVLGGALSPARAPADDQAAAVRTEELRRPFGRADFHALVALDEAVGAAATEIGVLREHVEWLLGRVVVENRRRIAMTARAKKAESTMRLRSKIARRLESSPAGKGLAAWRESRARRGGRWEPPTDQVFAAEVEQMRERMRDAR